MKHETLLENIYKFTFTCGLIMLSFELFRNIWYLTIMMFLINTLLSLLIFMIYLYSNHHF